MELRLNRLLTYDYWRSSSVGEPPYRLMTSELYNSFLNSIGSVFIDPVEPARSKMKLSLSLSVVLIKKEPSA